MLGGVIRKFCHAFYSYPEIPQNVTGNGPFGRLKIALLADYFTTVCLGRECRIRSLAPGNIQDIIVNWNPDLVFVESAFHGIDDQWRYKLQKQPIYLRIRQSPEIPRIARLAADRNIPAVFWNKDDKAFFSAFIDVARHFRYVFTTDADCIAGYRRELPASSHVDVLGMPYQPAFHNFTGFNFKTRDACFVGSYYRKILHKRRCYLDMIFNSCAKSKISLHVYDRNSSRLSHFFEFRFPSNGEIQIHPGVPYPATASIYKSHTISINVNSITDSSTMYSRRLLEILACGGICVTNGNPAVKKEFSEYCHIVDTAASASETLARLAQGPQTRDREMAAAGAEYVAREHTWLKRLEKLADAINL